MDPVALDAILHQCRTHESALTVYMERCPGLTKVEATAGLWTAIEHSGWALLVAPELWAVAGEWYDIAQYDDDLRRLRAMRNFVMRQTREPSTWRVVEIDTGKVRARPPTDDMAMEFYSEIKVGPDVLSVRSSAVAKLAAEITRAMEARARARGRFVKAVLAYQRRLEVVQGWDNPKKAKEILSKQAWIEGELAVFASLQATGEPPKDEAGIRAVCASLDRRLMDRSAR